MFASDRKTVKILLPLSLSLLLVFSVFFNIDNVSADERPSVITNPFCSLTWDDPKDGSGNGLRKIGETDNVTFNVSGLAPNQSFTVKNFHNSSSFTKTGGTQNANDSGVWSLYDQTPILDSEYGEHLGAYTTKIVDSSGNPIATCGGFTLTRDVAPVPSCSLTWDDPKDSSGNGLRKIGEFDNVTFNVSGLAPNQSFAIKNFHNTSDFTRISDSQIANGSGAWNLYDHTQILDSEYGAYLGVYTTKIVDNSGFPIATCGSFTLSKDTPPPPPPPPTNTAPSIALVGSDPMNLTVGAVFSDPGATAADVEDGDLTTHIVVTGVVNTSVSGSYTLNYSVTDSGGLAASTTRTVIVSQVAPPSDFSVHIFASKIVCDSESDLPNWGLGGPDITANTAAQFVNSHSATCRLVSDWKFQWASSTALDPGPSFVGEASGWHTFGPTNEQGIATTTILVSPTASRIWFREVLKENYLGFSTVAENNSRSAEMYCNTDVLNYDNYDLIANPFIDGATYHCVAFNVLKSVTPPVNTPPVITLLGANPFAITVGNAFVDPGATSTDAEDGDLTSQIVRTGSVDTAAAGSYTLTYVVRDSGNLYATTTRVVVVNPATCTSNCGGGDHLPTVSLSSNPSTIILGATSTLSWTSTNTTSCSAIWTSATSTTGTQIVSPLVSTSYAISCIGSEGSSTATTSITVSTTTPPANTPPVITLLGANPFSLTVGNTFTDPGATSTDVEDGDLTSQIVVTGTVNTSVVGTYTLTYVVRDSGNLYATTTRTVNVNATSTPPVVPPITPPVNPPTNNGGGGGGQGGHRHPVVVGEILGATSCLYLRDYLKIDWENDTVEVLKLQSFLNVFEKENLSFTGKFDQSTLEAVARFQTKYSKDILAPWGDKVTTGFVYILTKKKINEIYCNTILALSGADQSEIEAFRSSGTSTYGAIGQQTPSDDKGQNFAADTKDATDENVSSRTKDVPVIELVASSSDDSIIKNAAISLFALPQKIFSDWRYFLAFLVFLAIVVTIIRMFMSSDNDRDDFSDSLPLKTPITPKQTGDKNPPIIVLPGAIETKSAEVLPDEEIVIENPEEGPDEIIVATPDFESPSAEQEDESR